MTQRTRTHAWADPAELAAAAMSRPGLEFMQAMGRGELPMPPISSLIGMEGCAVHTTCEAGTGYTSLEVELNFVPGISARTGLLHATGTVVHRGRRVATAEGRLTEAAGGRLLAHASTTCLILVP